MNSLTITQTKANGIVEGPVSNLIITKLYNIGKDDDEHQTLTVGVDTTDENRPVSTVSGRIRVNSAFANLLEYLAVKFPDLEINADSTYIYFEDSEVESVLLAASIGDGVGITASDAANANIGTIFKNNTAITSFNTFGYFNRANTSPTNEMFRGCTNLESIDFSNVTRFSNRLFQGTNITDVNAPNLVSSDVSVFVSCPSLQSVTSLGNLASIPDSMFWECNNLQTVNLPDNCTTISDSAFIILDSSTGNLLQVNGIEHVSSFGYRCFLKQKMLRLTANDLTNAVSIGEKAFLNVLVSSINSPKLMTLGEISFADNSALTTIECLGKVSNIPSSCFGNDPSLLTVKIPYECTTIDNNAFNGCSSLTSIKQYTDSIDNWVEEEEPTTGSLSRVTVFGNGCFENCSLLSLTLQDIQNATTIGNSAFYNTLLSGPIDLSNTTSIGTSPFSNTKITSVIFALSTIPSQCFSNCKLLSEIHLANTVHNFSGGCFLGCTNLLSVDYDFTNCTNLEYRCFLGCSRFDVVALTQVVNDSNAANMDHSCFLDTLITLLYLPKIEIPKYNNTNYYQDEWNFLSRTNIGILYFKQLRKMYPGWFSLSTVLKLVINNTTPPQWCYPNDASTYSLWYENKTLCLAKNVSGSSIIYCTNDIYVPDSAVSTYLADANWSAVAQYIKPISDLQTVATKALWDALPAADKPNTLIEEYMD